MRLTKEQLQYKLSGLDNHDCATIMETFDALESEKVLARALGRDELILRHQCGCEVCSRTSQLCPATASAIAMEQTSTDFARALALREVAAIAESVAQEESVRTAGRSTSEEYQIGCRNVREAILALSSYHAWAMAEHDRQVRLEEAEWWFEGHSRNDEIAHFAALDGETK